MSNPAARGDDSFSGEISEGEALGEDNPMGYSSDNDEAVDPTNPDVHETLPGE